ncbi:hypothetical protein AALP_AA3G181400 [Arabis alpina]|uniref:MD-2-related lipid-recognition domain-containing protein n=1 Tax=Arabis alpina TaxID=50452 RepID=A0A087HA00_ARAAL|nr:hypothetical protein AALP_AA3G181400 [Arabis alpina]
MALSHAHPLLLLFLVSLFVLPALSIKFFKCSTAGEDIEVKTVDISPHPVNRKGNANITVTGYTSKDIPDGASVGVTLAVLIPISEKTYSLCDVTACPVAPGPFVLTIPNIFNDKALKRRTRAYNVIVTINEEPEHARDVMCVNFVCKMRSSYMSLLSQVTE